MARTKSEVLKKLLNAYVDSKGHDLPNKADFNNTLHRIPADETADLVTSTKCADQCTAVHYAAMRNHAWIMQSILWQLNENDKRYKLLTMSSSYGSTSLHLAVEHRSISTLQCMLQSIAEDKRYELMKVVNKVGNTAIIGAAWVGCAQAMKLIMEILTPTERYKIVKIQNAYGNTAIHDAAQKGHTETLNCMMGFIRPSVQAVLFEIRNLDNRTALAFAKCKKNYETVDSIHQCMEIAEEHLVKSLDAEVQLRNDKQAQEEELKLKNEQLSEKERQLTQLINVVSAQCEQASQLTSLIVEQRGQIQKLTDDSLKAMAVLTNQKKDGTQIAVESEATRTSEKAKTTHQSQLCRDRVEKKKD